MSRLTTNPSPYIVNIPELQNVQTNASGQDTFTSLQSRVDQIGQMVNFADKQIATNSIKAYSGSNITFLNNVILSNATLTGVGTGSVGSSGTSKQILLPYVDGPIASWSVALAITQTRNVEIRATITAYATSTGKKTYSLQRDGITIATGKFYFTSANTHMTLPELCGIVSNDLGSHVYSIVLGTDVVVDANDVCFMIATLY
jgi:hypothetical protein